MTATVIRLWCFQRGGLRKISGKLSCRGLCCTLPRRITSINYGACDFGLDFSEEGGIRLRGIFRILDLAYYSGSPGGSDESNSDSPSYKPVNRTRVLPGVYLDVYVSRGLGGPGDVTLAGEIRAGISERSRGRGQLDLLISRALS